eukprot:CAMPEP_0170370012 /NCGR_PEP_ID=MMETSP0117_2-20130122/8287_1 /TAXON_ID=400756 /ORGANISM="Durinskia baltica, Strain CSIRO CS-38" /LENGTH=31 /DNA_ID= /DNA_START= /DNA_END= /DNA_ORIENTATION=
MGSDADRIAIVSDCGIITTCFELIAAGFGAS